MGAIDYSGVTSQQYKQGRIPDFIVEKYIEEMSAANAAQKAYEEAYIASYGVCEGPRYDAMKRALEKAEELRKIACENYDCRMAAVLKLD